MKFRKKGKRSNKPNAGLEPATFRLEGGCSTD